MTQDDRGSRRNAAEEQGEPQHVLAVLLAPLILLAKPDSRPFVTCYDTGREREWGAVHMGGIVFLWILLVVVAFVNHQDTLVAWVLGATFVLGVIGAMMNASSEEKEALERVRREKRNQDRMKPSPGVVLASEVRQTAGNRSVDALVNTNTVRQGDQGAYQLPDCDKTYIAYTTARETMRRRLRYMELKYPLNLSKEHEAGQSPIEAALQRAETHWRSSKSYHPYDFFQLADNINALQMWVTVEDMEAFCVDAENLHRCWKGGAALNVWLPQRKD